MIDLIRVIRILIRVIRVYEKGFLKNRFESSRGNCCRWIHLRDDLTRLHQIRL